jgi:hypothetical protein
LETIFWSVWKQCRYQLPSDKSKCYMFRLVTQGANIGHLLAGLEGEADPKSHASTDDERLVLVGVRDLATAEESLPEQTARENGWERPTERSDLAALVAQWAQQGEPTVAERKGWSRRGGGHAKPPPTNNKDKGPISAAEAVDEATITSKRQKYVLDKLLDACWELNVLEAQGVLVCGPGLDRIVVHSPPYDALASLGTTPFLSSHGAAGRVVEG